MCAGGSGRGGGDLYDALERHRVHTGGPVRDQPHADEPLRGEASRPARQYVVVFRQHVGGFSL